MLENGMHWAEQRFSKAVQRPSQIAAEGLPLSRRYSTLRFFFTTHLLRTRLAISFRPFVCSPALLHRLSTSRITYFEVRTYASFYK